MIWYKITNYFICDQKDQKRGLVLNKQDKQQNINDVKPTI